MFLSWLFLKNYIFSSRSGSLVRVISWISVSAIAIGMFSFIVVQSVMNGFNNNIWDRILAAEPHLVLTFDDIKSSEDLKKLKVYEFLKKQPNTEVYLCELSDVILRTEGGLFRGVIAKGLEQDNINTMMDAVYRSGQRRSSFQYRDFFDLSQYELNEGEVLIGAELASRLDLFEGDTVLSTSPDFLLMPQSEVPMVKRLVIKKIITTHSPHVDSNYVFYRIGQNFLDRNYGTATLSYSIEVRTSKPNDLGLLLEKISPFSAHVETWKDRNLAMVFALKMEKIVIGIFIGLSGLIAGFSIITVLVLLISQKKQEIGILLASGLSSKQVRAIFRNIGLFLSVSGLMVGFVLAILFCLGIKYLPLDILPDIYYDSRIPAEINWSLSIFSMFICMILAFLGSTFPTRYFSKNLSPAEILKKNKA